MSSSRKDHGEECLVDHVYDQSGLHHPEAHKMSNVRRKKVARVEAELS